MSNQSSRARGALAPTVLVILVLAVLSTTPRAAAAQQPAGVSDSVRRSAEQASALMVPMFARMAEITVETTLKTLSKPENTERLATFMRQYYEALIKQGFTKTEALQIVVAAGLPTAPGMK